MGHVELQNITKRYRQFQAVTDLSLVIEKGEFCALLAHRVVANPPCCV